MINSLQSRHLKSALYEGSLLMAQNLKINKNNKHLVHLEIKRYMNNYEFSKEGS